MYLYYILCARRCPWNKNKFIMLKKIFFLFYPMLTLGYPGVLSKKLSPFGPAVWPAIHSIYLYTNVLFYYIDNKAKIISDIIINNIDNIITNIIIIIRSNKYNNYYFNTGNLSMNLIHGWNIGRHFFNIFNNHETSSF